MRQLAAASRSLLKSPVFTMVAVLSLAVAMGANSAIFALIDAVLLKPLPGIHQPDRLISIYHVNARDPKAFSPLSWPDFEYYQERAHSVTGFVAYLRLAFAARLADRVENIPGELVNEDYFRTLGVPPRLGRDFAPNEPDRVAVISEHLWRTRFSADPAVIGRAIPISGQPFTIIGVAPAEFRGVVLDWGDRPDVWIPMRHYAEAVPVLSRFDVMNAWGMQSCLVTARLREGVAPQQAFDEIAALARSVDSAHPERAAKLRGEWTARAFPLGEARFWPGARGQILTVLSILLAVSAGVLLIACANLTSLMLTRAAQRSREVALRFALGARARDVARLLIAEGAVIAAAGCAAGLALGYALVRGFATFPKLFSIPLALDLRLDLRVAAFTAAVAALAGLLTGLTPLRQAMATDLVSSLRAAGASASAHRRWSLRTILTGLQIAVSLVLLVEAGLFLRTFRNAANADPFLRAGNLLISRVETPSPMSPKTARELSLHLREIPGVEQAVMAAVLPMGGMRSAGDIAILDDEAERKTNVDINAVTPGFLALTGASLLQGRDFTDADVEGRPLVALANEAAARRYWNGQALDRRIRIGADVVTVVGVTRDQLRRSYRGLVPPRIYFPIAQRQWGAPSIVLRTHGAPMAALPELRSVIARTAPDAVLGTAQTLSAYTNSALAQERLAAWCLGSLAAIALLLSAVGLYGTTAYSVAQRTAEIGIRMALGGARTRVTAAIMRPAAVTALIGAAAGVLLSAASERVTQSLLYGVTGSDPLTWASATAILIAAVVLAAAIPALRASRIDPASALRGE